MKNRSYLYSGLIILGALVLGFFNLPSATQQSIIPFTPQAILDNEIHLGLDLQGGAQLDYKVDLRNVPEEDKRTVIDGILSVINKRVNSLGVAEPSIYTSDVGEEKHIIVELAGIQDLEQAKNTVGKTIQLEFKEQKTADEQNDPNLEEEIRGQAQALLDRALAGESLQTLGQEEQQANPSVVTYFESGDWRFEDEIISNFRGPLFELEKGQILDRLVDSSGNITINESGEFISGPSGFHIVQVTDIREEERTIDTPREVKVRHILVAYQGAERANEEITRSESEAESRAQEALRKINDGGDFNALAGEYSDDEGSKENGGLLDSPVSLDSGLYVKEFENAALSFTEKGQSSGVIESPFGYHILKAEEITEAKTEVRTEKQVQYVNVHYSAAPDPWKPTELNGQHFVRADVEFTQAYQPFVSITFDDEGAKLFEELTKRNLNKPIAIFVGGELISAPNVNEVIVGGQASITGQYTVESANDLARDLNTGAIPAPITLAGQYSIGASLGAESLSSSLQAGVIGVLLVALFMTLYYRLPGFLSVLALGAYSILLVFVIKVEMSMLFALGLSTIIFSNLVWRIVKNKDSGAEKAVSAILASFILFFLTFVLATPIVLTLAGIAGVILSIGMAVDANILIFERIKEEIAEGRPLEKAIEVGFDRAWSSIRDSNFSSLLTCAILFYFGSSIIQGFAFNLAAGILISMVTAISITKTFIATAAKTKLGKNLWLFNKPSDKPKKPLQIISKRKSLYVLSSIIIVITLLGLPFFGLKLGLDFTGGTLMEINFEQKYTTDQVKDGLITAGQNLDAIEETATTTNETEEEPTENTSESTDPAEPALIAATEEVDLTKAQVITSENGFIIKTPHISSDAHDVLLDNLRQELGELEETRFSTVGPTVGNDLKQRAVSAIILAVIMIILYIAFAFRKVPRSIGKWRFGLTAILALIHDLAIMLGVYVYLGVFLGVEIDALFITAMLTVLGFSVHDTIVVFDRIREKLRFQKRDETFEDVCNQALNDTLARSINTSFSTLVVLLALAILGGETIRYFVIALLVGIVSGTYSSIFVATPILVDWVKKKRRQ